MLSTLRWRKVLCTVALAGSLSIPAAAQTDGERLERNNTDRVLDAVELIVSMAATLQVTSRQCRLGDPEAWTRVIDSVDRRYRRCVAPGSPLEQAVARRFSSQRASALAAGKSVDLGSLAWAKWLPIRSRVGMSDDPKDACSKVGASPTFKAVLDPESVTPQLTEAAFEEERNEIQTHRDNLWTFSSFAHVRALGADQACVEAPCDVFFPERSGK